MKPLLAWSLVLLACAVVGFRIVTNPATPHPVTAGVIVAVLILVGVYLALAEHFSADRRCERYERKVQRDMAKNLAVALAFVASSAEAGTIYNHPTPDGKRTVEVCDCYRHQVYEIRAKLNPDGPWYHVGANVPALQDVRQDLIVTDSRVVWVQGETASGSNFALRSSPIDAPNFSVVISHRGAQNGVGFDLPIQKISGDRVRFRSDPFVDESFAVYVTPIGGGAIQQEIFREDFERGTKGGWR